MKKRRLSLGLDVSTQGISAVVAGVGAFLKSEGDTIDTEQYVGALLKREQPVQPRTEDVLAFHRHGGYLDTFAAEEARLLAQPPLK